VLQLLDASSLDDLRSDAALERVKVQMGRLG